MGTYKPPLHLHDGHAVCACSDEARSSGHSAAAPQGPITVCVSGPPDGSKAHMLSMGLAWTRHAPICDACQIVSASVDCVGFERKPNTQKPLASCKQEGACAVRKRSSAGLWVGGQPHAARCARWRMPRPMHTAAYTCRSVTTWMNGWVVGG